MLWVIFFVMLIGLMSLFTNYFQFLKSLLVMEFINMIILLMILSSVYGIGGHNVLFFLILSICEGVLGLFSIILIYRFWGSDSYLLVDYDVN